MQILLSIIVVVATEFSTNTATGSVFIPIAFSMVRFSFYGTFRILVYRNQPYFQAEELRVHPLFFSIPAAIGPSFSFMLPMATPPNAIVYETKTMTMWEMVSTVDYGRSTMSSFRHRVESFSTSLASQSRC